MGAQAASHGLFQPPIFIGAIQGGRNPQEASIDAAFHRLGREIDSAQNNLESQFQLNVQFHISGSVIANEFEGIRTGTMSRKLRKLIVQVAVPDTPTNHDEFFLEALDQAVDLASLHLQRRKVDASLESARLVVRRIRDERARGQSR